MRIVVESKAQRNYSEADALEELEEARENRDAQVGIFVVKCSSAPDGLEGFRRLGTNILAVWDPEDPTTDLYLRAALDVACALAVREHRADEETEANVREIERCVTAIEKEVNKLDAIAKAARIVEQKGSSILELAEAMKESLVADLESLA